MTWSNYMHHNTVKILLGITSQSVISFVSDSWGSHTNEAVLDDVQTISLVNSTEHHHDERKETQKDELSMVRSDLARVSNKLFQMKKNLRSCTKKEERIKSYLQDKYRVPF